MENPAARDGAPAIVALPAEIDMTNAGQVYDVLSAAVASGAPLIIAELTDTVLCDAGGVRRLLMIREAAAARGALLRPAIPPGALLRRVLVLLRVDHLLPVYSSVGEASGLLAAREDPMSFARSPSASQPEAPC